MTGFPPAVCSVMTCRSGGLCEVCGCNRATQKHHRRPRQAGGSKRQDTNTASNGLDTCNFCHTLIEMNRALAYLVGWLVPQTQSPTEQRVLYRGDFVLLDDDGLVHPVQDWRAA